MYLYWFVSLSKPLKDMRSPETLCTCVMQGRKKAPDHLLVGLFYWLAVISPLLLRILAVMNLYTTIDKGSLNSIYMIDLFLDNKMPYITP